ncbi:MAG: epoxyqueuosine reductase [Candidatus Omnitrophica bacterium]|nr:epoxyqueuosine reductase [Candidatus Omnitrophota bacterium]
MGKENYYQELKRFSKGLGVDLFGVADISQAKEGFALTAELSEKLKRAVSLGVRLSEGVLEEIQGAPNKLYFHHYRTANSFLDQVAFKVAHHIQKKGFLALAIPASQILDWQKQSAHLSHKKVGVLAGLGWIGRNNLLVNKALGSQFRLATVLTDMPLKADRISKEDCGSCRLCIEVCPAGAIKDDPAQFDHLSCFEKLKEFQAKRLADQYICGVCVKACCGSGEE